MQASERSYTAVGIGAAIVMAAFILGYRVLVSDPHAAVYPSNDKANHHPRAIQPADRPGVAE